MRHKSNLSAMYVCLVQFNPVYFVKVDLKRLYPFSLNSYTIFRCKRSSYSEEILPSKRKVLLFKLLKRKESSIYLSERDHERMWKREQTLSYCWWKVNSYSITPMAGISQHRWWLGLCSLAHSSSTRLVGLPDNSRPLCGRIVKLCLMFFRTVPFS